MIRVVDRLNLCVGILLMVIGVAVGNSPMAVFGTLGAVCGLWGVLVARRDP